MLTNEELDAWLSLDRELSILELYRKQFNLYSVEEIVL